MPAKRIAILGTRGIPARYGGFETFAEELALRLDKKGVDTTVYCERNKRSRPDLYQGIKLQYVPSRNLGPLTTILFDLRCLWHSRKDYEVVYMLGYGASIFCFIPRIWGNQVWINMDGIEWARSKWNSLAKVWFKSMEAFAMRTSNRIIADADGILQHLQSRHKRMPPFSVIPYGASVVENTSDVNLLRKWGLNKKEYYILVCRLEPENYVREIIEGFSASKSLHPLIIVGDHAAKTSYINLLLRTANARIRFIGTVYDKKNLQVLRYHSIAYFHGHSVGGTNPSLLEALGCGNIVIAHDNIFNRETAGDIAFYFKNSQEIPAILEIVETLSIKERSKKAAIAKTIVREKYNWDDIADKYFQLLRQNE